MSASPSVPRFDPSGRAPGRLAERRRRLIVLGAGAVLLVLIAASVGNAGRFELRCVDGLLVAYRGQALPLGEDPVDETRFPPLAVPAAACEDEVFADASSFEARYLELAVGRVDQAIRTEDRDALEAAMQTLESVSELTSGSRASRERHRALMQALLNLDVAQARDSRRRALERLEKARRLGIDDDVLRAAEQALGLPGKQTAPPTAAEPPAPPPARSRAPTRSSPSKPRTL